MKKKEKGVWEGGGGGGGMKLTNAHSNGKKSGHPSRIEGDA